MSSETSARPARRLRVTSTLALSFTFLVIFCGAVAMAALGYPPKAAAMPLLVGGVGAALSLLQLIIELSARRGADAERIELAKDLPIYAWVWAFIIAVVAFGFLLAAPPMLFIYLRFRSRESWWLSLALPLAVLGLLYGLFQAALGVPLFEGLITPIAMDWLRPS